MKKRNVLMAAMLTLFSAALMVAGIAAADRDDDEGRYNSKSGGTLSAVNNQLYKTECGSCHFAYQPGWLPSRSWTKMMGELDHHFGDNAELSLESQTTITVYLVSESADNHPHRKSRKILRSVGADAVPQRVSTLSYMQRKHDEISGRYIQGNPKVRSLSNCVACHRQAEKGRFDEHGVNIPGYGVWED